MTPRYQLEARIFRKMRGRRWTWRRWWIRAGAIAVCSAAVSRKMHLQADAARELENARYCRRMAAFYDRQRPIKE
jgi:hypothetical protein